LANPPRGVDVVNAVRFHEFGAADVLTYEEVDDPQPAAGQALITVEAVGLNYIDTYQRSGTRPGLSPPSAKECPS
jgi:NADPH2:quinone reductase